MNTLGDNSSWSQFVGLSTGDNEIFDEQDITGGDFSSFNFPANMETGWENLVPMSETGYDPRAFTEPYNYMETTSPLCVDPMQMHIYPPMESYSSSEYEASSDGTATPRPHSPVAYAHNGLTTDGPKESTQHFLVEPERRVTQQPSAQVQEDLEFKFWAHMPVPANAVFNNSPPEAITAAMNRLSYLLSEARVASSRHHPFMRCPVYDCDQGGYHPLLHGGSPSDNGFTREAAAKAAVDHKYPAGVFTKRHDIVRHVRSVHTPDRDLRCYRPECAFQARLNRKGRSTRPDRLRQHFKKEPEHRESLPENVRAKYKL